MNALVTEEKRLELEQQSTAVSNAYQTIKDPYQRAIYLLKLNGIAVDFDKDNNAELHKKIPNFQMILFEVMEMREELEDNPSSKPKIKTDLKEKLAGIVANIKNAFDSNKYELALQHTITYNYYNKLYFELND